MMDRLAALVSRGVAKLVTEATKLRGVQVALLRGGDTEADAEHFEPAGFTAAPLVGAEAIVVHVGGDTDHPIVLVVTDRRYRPLDLASGECVVYAPTTGGKQIRLTATTVKLGGTGATKAVIRAGDSTLSNASTDAPFWTWFALLLAAWNAAAVAGGPLIVPIAGAPVVVTSQAGVSVGGSTVVKAVD